MRKPVSEPKIGGRTLLKPHRIVLDKVNSYTDEAAAFMRRRRHHRREFVRIRFCGGAEVDLTADDEGTERISSAARRLIDLG